MWGWDFSALQSLWAARAAEAPLSLSPGLSGTTAATAPALLPPQPCQAPGKGSEASPTPWQGQGTHGNHCTRPGSPHYKMICLEVRQLPSARQNISREDSASQDLWGKKRSLRFGFETRLTGFFRSAVASTALLLPGEVLGEQLF